MSTASRLTQRIDAFACGGDGLFRRHPPEDGWLRSAPACAALRSHRCAEDCGFDRLLLFKDIRRPLGR